MYWNNVSLHSKVALLRWLRAQVTRHRRRQFSRCATQVTTSFRHHVCMAAPITSLHTHCPSWESMSHLLTQPTQRILKQRSGQIRKFYTANHWATRILPSSPLKKLPRSRRNTGSFCLLTTPSPHRISSVHSNGARTSSPTPPPSSLAGMEHPSAGSS